jgi:exodeoxyribonuclease V alpha subunit
VVELEQYCACELLSRVHTTNASQATIESLTATQNTALNMAMNNGVSIIIGGGGTGKTHTIKEIVYHAEGECLGVFLSSPTGKAAQLLESVTNRKARTLHSLLNLLKNNRDLEIDLLIIDESSMIDIELFARLLSKLPDHTQLLFVGDQNQLPPVGIGSPFRDLIESNVIPTTQLTEVKRQSEQSGIIMQAKRILDKQPVMNDRDVTVFSINDNPDQINTIVKHWITEYSKEGVQIICACNESGSYSVRSINESVRPLFNDSQTHTPDGLLYLNDRVMFTANNYDIGCRNGMQGKLTAMTDDSYVVVTDGVELIVPIADDLIVPAYCVTAHKAQGSQWPCVVIVMPNAHKHIAKRQWCYTALTRAESRAVFVADADAIEYAARTSQADRKTLMKTMLTQSNPNSTGCGERIGYGG